MGLFDKFKKQNDSLDKQIAELQAKNDAMSKSADAVTLASAQNMANSFSVSGNEAAAQDLLNSITSAAQATKQSNSVHTNVSRNRLQARKLVGGEEALCSCGCGKNAEYMFEIGDLNIPISNGCGNNISLQHLEIGEVVYDDCIETRVIRLTGTTTQEGVKIDFDMRGGFTDDDDNHSVIMYNDTSGKGVKFTWEQIQFLAIELGILD